MSRFPRTGFTVPVVAMTLASAVFLGGGASAAPSPVDLGTAGGFAVLGGQTVTNTGPSVITGDLGLSPGSAVTGFPPGVVSPPGTIHRADTVAAQAQNDVTTAYNTAAGLPCLQDLTGNNLGGLTLTPGVYCFSSSAQLTGTLTLDGLGDPEADFVFQTGSTFTTASASSVVLIGQAQPCRVFYKVGSSGTLGTGSHFVGTILALTSITATTGTSVEGRLLARNGAVTLDSNTVTRPMCLPATTTSSTAPATTSSIEASTGTSTPRTRGTPTTITTRSTIPTITAATIPGRNSSATTKPTKASARTTSTRLATTGGQFAVLVAVALLAMVAGAMLLCAPRLATRLGSKV